MNFSSMPSLVRVLCAVHDGWIIGSAANPNLQSTAELRDIDIIIEAHHWPQAAAMIITQGTIQPNTFGGWKVTIGDLKIDIWPDTLNRLASMKAFKYAWHPKSGIRLASL